MNKWWRILKVWYKGKLPYAKRVIRWTRGMLIRDLQQVAPIYFERMVEKYGSDDFTTTMELLAKISSQIAENKN